LFEKRNKVNGKIYIYSLKDKDLNELKPLLLNSEMLPYKQYSFLNADDLVRFTISELSNILKSDPMRNGIFVAVKDDKILGLISLKFANWDSQQFEMGMAKIPFLFSFLNSYKNSYESRLKKHY